MIYSTLRLLALLISRVFFRFKAYGREYIPKKGGFILASNHVSYLDPILVGVASPRKLSYMAKEELFRNRISARFLKSIKVFPIKRSSADISGLKQALRRVKAGDGLLLFPAGTRSSEGQRGQALGGVGFLAAKLNCPVVPVFVKGTEEALPRHAKVIHFAKVSVFFGKEIYLEKGLPYQAFAERIMDSIRQLSIAV